MAQQGNPQWWGTQHTSTWDRVKEALSRDWEQTKADFSNEYGKDLNQDVGDTVKQAMGKEPIPAPNQKTPEEPKTASQHTSNWNDAEPAIRYGYGASDQYKEHQDWDDKVEAKLKEEWHDLKSGRTWDEAKTSVRYGWDRARKSVGSKN